MEEKKIHILLIEDSPGDTRLISESLSELKNYQLSLLAVHTLTEGIVTLKKELIDVIILDLFLPESKGIDTLMRVKAVTPEIPVVILTGLDDEKMATEALQFGAQDYLIKGETTGNLIARSIRYAIQRNKMQMAVQSLSLLDELTGLYNRRGFITLATKHVTLAKRTDRKIFLFFIDLDEFKRINDTFGHAEGDKVLIDTAEILRETFRESDIIGRIGGDEFAVIAIESGTNPSDTIIAERLLQNVEQYNNKKDRGYKLGLSIGISHTPQDGHDSVGDLLHRADVRMYEQKKSKKKNKTDRR